YQSETVYRTYSVPIEYRNLQTSTIIPVDSVPMEARITLAGAEQAFRTINRAEIVVSFNMTNKDTGISELLITRQNLNLPANIDLYEVTPKSLDVKERELANIRVPVHVATTGRLPDEKMLASVTSIPEQVDILMDNSNRIVLDSI